MGRLVEEALRGWFSERCKEKEIDCIVCQAWEEYDRERKVDVPDKETEKS